MDMNEISGTAPPAEAEESARVPMNEVSHRMKNNMQMLQSLLGVAGREASIPEASEILADVARRVAAMSAAQDSLYSADATQLGTAFQKIASQILRISK